MQTKAQTMQLTYTGPVKQPFGLQLKNGERIRVQPGKPFTVGSEDGRHVLRRWSSLFEEVKAPQPEPEPKPKKTTRSPEPTELAEEAK